MNLVLPDCSGIRVLVAGDLMLDRYWSGATSRISPEAPVPVVHVGMCEERPGGAGNVAVNIAVLGGRVMVDGRVGTDEAGGKLQRLLSDDGIHCLFRPEASITTITKMRVLSRHQQLIRLDFEDDLAGTGGDAALLQRFRDNLADTDLVVLSDYAKGTLESVPDMIRMATAAGKAVLIDPKGTDFSRYAGATILTPNQAEFEAVAGHFDNDDELTARGQALCASLDLDALLITRSEKGMSLVRSGHATLHFPAQARDVFDVTGAGDTVISILAAMLAAGSTLENAVGLANLGAGIAVSKLGAVAVTGDELRHALLADRLPSLKSEASVLDERTLLDLVHSARSLGERIVMTNGCFDILHAGHVGYLEQARQLGDRLIVAVNDDNSVSALKASGRPVNALSHRMKVLAALNSVDWVVPFTEATPERLICLVKPDVLVKGGDYQADAIAGAECVRQHGGEVVLLPYQEGLSTSRIIEKILRTT